MAYDSETHWQEVPLMTSGTLNDNDRKAELSFAFLSALAATVGFTCQRGPHPDRWKVDAELRSGDYLIDVQLKATSSPQRRDDGLHFRLDKATYDTLRNDSRPSPIILAVLELPEDPSQWLECTSEILMLRRRLWWNSLVGYPEIRTESKIIVIPEGKYLDPMELTKMMERTQQGRSLKE